MAVPLLIFTVVLLNSCSGNYCDTLTKSIKSQCPVEESNCKVTFNKTFPFNWDTMYIFDSMLYPDEVSSVIGANCKCDIVPEGKRLLIFMKGGSIVKKQTTRCSDITFVNMRNQGVVIVDRYATFKLVTKDINGEYHYYLHKLDN